MNLVALATTLTDMSPFSRQDPPDSCLPFIRRWLKYGMTPNQYQARRLRFMEAFSQQLAACTNQHSHVTGEGPPTSLPETFSFYLEGFRFSYHHPCRHYPCREEHNARHSPPDNHTYTVMIEHMETRRTLIRTLDAEAFNKVCTVLYLRKLTGSPLTSPVFTGEGRMNLRALPLRRHSLNNLDLSGADLSYSTFSGARLTGVKTCIWIMPACTTRILTGAGCQEPASHEPPSETVISQVWYADITSLLTPHCQERN